MVPSPSLAREFHELVTVLMQKVRNLKRLNEKRRTARDLLLPRLRSGEIAV